MEKYLVETRSVKYILKWKTPTNEPLTYMGEQRNGFIGRGCKLTNCYVTSNRTLFGDYTKFDVIIFAGPELQFLQKDKLPVSRLIYQKYVYANIESAANYPVCTNQFDNFFNWTWTYRLDSDLRWGYIVIRDEYGKIVGPNKVMNWIKHEHMLPVRDRVKKVLRGKTKLAAWFVSKCNSISKREHFVEKLSEILNTKYNISIDIYGDCGPLKCSRQDDKRCQELIKRDYYFYLSFENALSKDYVTEKLLNAVQNYAIPIVYGGANYSRFLPKGSYLNARCLGTENLAEKMIELMNNFDQYLEYFKWTSHYTYHSKAEKRETDSVCEMCAVLNNLYKVTAVTTYKHFYKWWTPVELCKDVVDSSQCNDKRITEKDTSVLTTNADKKEHGRHRYHI